jgi:hypothetical protein
MMNMDSEQSAAQIAAQLEQWLQSRERLKGTCADVVHLDLQILPFKKQYVHNGAIFGANSAWMVRWFAEARRDVPAPAVTPASGDST